MQSHHAKCFWLGGEQRAPLQHRHSLQPIVLFPWWKSGLEVPWLPRNNADDFTQKVFQILSLPSNLDPYSVPKEWRLKKNTVTFKIAEIDEKQGFYLLMWVDVAVSLCNHFWVTDSDFILSSEEQITF